MSRSKGAAVTNMQPPSARIAIVLIVGDAGTAEEVGVLKPIRWGDPPVESTQVIVKQANVTTCHLERSRAVAQYALQREDVAAVRQERPGKGVPKDVWRAAAGQPSRTGKASD